MNDKHIPQYRSYFLSLILTFLAFLSIANAAKINTTHKIYVSGEMVQVVYSGLPGNASDWITIVPKKSHANSYYEWNYTKGNAKGTMNFFNSLPPGLYEARLYTDWDGRASYKEGYTVRASSSFRVVEDSFRKWLWQQDNATLQKYAKSLSKQLDGWIAKGEKKVSKANLNLIALRAAKKELRFAMQARKAESAAAHIDAAFDGIGTMADIVVLKGLLEFITSPPNNMKAATALKEAIKAGLKRSKYIEKKEEIEKAISEGAPDAYKKAQKKLQEAEDKIFGDE